MNKTVIALFLILLISQTASAQAVGTPDCMGIFFDLDGYVYCTTTAAPFQQVTAYLLLLNPSHSSGVKEYSLQVAYLGVPAVAEQWSVGGIDLEFIEETGIISHVFPEPLFPVNNVTRLATYTGFIMSPTDEVLFVLYPAPDETNPEAYYPYYVAGDDTLVPFTITTGYPYGTPCALINSYSGCWPNANEDVTWGQVKTLYN
jgi:hypothetical protein